jgi:hypothetical protein
MLKSLVISILDGITGLIFFWDESDTKRIEDINRARDKVVSGHDDVLIDSSKAYLLICTKQGLYLVARNEPWKARLNERAEAAYLTRGKRAFSRIRNQIE